MLSAVTAHVREKRSTWGIAIEDADMTDLDRRAIADVRLVPVAAPAHALARRAGPDRRAPGSRTRCRSCSASTVTTASAGSDDHGVFSPRTWRVVDLATKHALIASGLGWGHMPEHLVRDDLRAGRLVELELEAWGQRRAPPVARARPAARTS